MFAFFVSVHILYMLNYFSFTILSSNLQRRTDFQVFEVIYIFTFFQNSKIIFGSSKYPVKIGLATHTRCLSPCMGLHFKKKTSQTDEVTRKGLKFVFEMCWCWELTKLPDSGLTSSPLQNKENGA